MAIRNDIPAIPILLVHFQEFDHGEQVIETLPAEWGPKMGDLVEWECAQFIGTARVISVRPADDEKVTCVLQKVS